MLPPFPIGQEDALEGVEALYSDIAAGAVKAISSSNINRAREYSEAAATKWLFNGPFQALQMTAHHRGEESLSMSIFSKIFI